MNDFNPTANTESVSGQILSGENTLIQFTGFHTDPEKPDPRTGQFQALTGAAGIAGGGLKSISVEIETPSIVVVDENLDAENKTKLTNHLKSADFFSVNEFPTASFQSTSIESVSDGEVNITGDLTLLGTTQSITFPATVSTADGLALDATFKLDRTEFGMDYGTDNIKKDVEMAVKIPK